MVLNEKFGRRDFLLTTAAAAAFTIVPSSVLGGPRHIAPSEKINIGGIGIGGQGASNLKALEGENIIALCDVDPLNYAAKTIKKYPKAKVYVDFREMLEKQKDLDAVVIATPDHTHAVITMAAMKAGKHVYCQKPLTHNVWEGAHDRRGRQKIRRGDPDGHPGPLRRGNPPDQRMDPGWRHRRRQGSPRLVQRLLLPLGPRRLEQQMGPRAPPRQDGRPQGDELGPLDRPGGDAPLSPGLSPAGLAQPPGVRQRLDGRPRRPHLRSDRHPRSNWALRSASTPPAWAPPTRPTPWPRSSPSASPRARGCRPSS